MMDTSTLINLYQTIQTQAISMAGSFIGQFVGKLWSENPTYVILFIVFLLLMRFFDKGIWSVIYNVFYFSCIGLIIWLKGWEILFNDYFKIFTFVFYLISYKLTGLIMKKMR